jgi:hypothetical protein
MFAPEIAHLMRLIEYSTDVQNGDTWRKDTALQILDRGSELIEQLMYDPMFRWTIENANAIRQRDPEAFHEVVKDAEPCISFSIVRRRYWIVWERLHNIPKCYSKFFERTWMTYSREETPPPRCSRGLFAFIFM